MSEPGLCPVITRPVRNIVPNLVYSARGHEVETVIIDGNIVMENRKVLTVNEKEVIYRAQKAAEGLALRAGEDFVNSGTKTVEMMEKGYL
jgi:5-methylthioadenosine/S-adenosylhomocysteine deaminase